MIYPQLLGLSMIIKRVMKKDSTNQNHPATRYDSTSIPPKTTENGQANHAHASFAFSDWNFYSKTHSSRNNKPPCSSHTAYCEGGLDIYVVTIYKDKIQQRENLYEVIVFIRGFMKRLTVARQRLALHDQNTKFLKSEWFIKKMALL